jgi:hypothetical protein
VRPQALAGLALDLVGVLDDPVQRPELRDPFGGGLRTHPGHSGEVVARLAHQRGQVPVAVRADTVPGGHRGRVHPGQLGDPADRIQHGDAVADQLERVPVAGGDQHLQAGRPAPAGEGGDHVVGLVSRCLHHRDPQRGEHLLDQADLAGEVARALRPAGLVGRVLLVAERAPGHVEGDRHVGRLLVPEHVDQHRGEPVDRVGRLPGGGREVLHRKCEERPVSYRVSVQQ